MIFYHEINKVRNHEKDHEKFPVFVIAFIFLPPNTQMIISKSVQNV